MLRAYAYECVSTLSWISLNHVGSNASTQWRCSEALCNRVNFTIWYNSRSSHGRPWITIGMRCWVKARASISCIVRNLKVIRVLSQSLIRLWQLLGKSVCRRQHTGLMLWQERIRQPLLQYLKDSKTPMWLTPYQAHMSVIEARLLRRFIKFALWYLCPQKPWKSSIIHVVSSTSIKHPILHSLLPHFIL